MKTLVVKRDEVQTLLTMPKVMESVKQAYETFARNKVIQPPIVSIEVPEHNGEVDIKAGYSLPEQMIGVKTAGGFWDNPKLYQLPTGLALICLYDAKSGFPVCIMDGTLITAYRTGAAGGISAQVLARSNSSIAGVIGTGVQARMQIIALKEVLPITTIKVWGLSQEKMAMYKQEMESLLGVEVILCDNPKQAVVGSDVVLTTTPSKQKIVMNEWIAPGTHLIAIGADMEGKQELDPEVFSRAKVVVDNPSECIKRGETQHAIEQKWITASDIHAQIGEILLGVKSGRTNDDEITIFDATGMSIQDITTACMVYKSAMEKGIGNAISLI